MLARELIALLRSQLTEAQRDLAEASTSAEADEARERCAEIRQRLFSLNA